MRLNLPKASHPPRSEQRASPTSAANETQCACRAASAKLQSFERAGAAPCIDIFKVSHGTGGMADIEPRRRARLAAFIVVVARRAIRRADHPAGAGQQQIDPAIFGL